ncbi:MAG: hypothetical protein ACLGHW_07310, partial [Gammaproteobacteria bacterium]
MPIHARRHPFARGLAAALAACAAALVGLALAQTPAPAPAAAAPAAEMPVPPPPAIVGAAWLLMDHATGRVLAGENIDVRREPASLTKVMTSYVVAAEMAAGKIKPD